MESVVRQAHAQLGLELPWLSWLQDRPGSRPDGDIGPWRCRVYGHRLQSAAPELTSGDQQVARYCRMATDELEQSNAEDRLESGALVGKWLHMWQTEEDEEGCPVTRSFGLPTTGVQYYSYNRTGDQRGTYRVGEFNQQGEPAPAAVEA